MLKRSYLALRGLYLVGWYSLFEVLDAIASPVRLHALRSWWHAQQLKVYSEISSYASCTLHIAITASV